MGQAGLGNCSEVLNHQRDRGRKCPATPRAHLSMWAPQPCGSSSLLPHPRPFSQQPLAASPSQGFQYLPLLCPRLLPGPLHHYIPFGESHSLFAVFLLPVPTHSQRDPVNTCVRARPPAQSPPVAQSHLGKDRIVIVIHKAPRDLPLVLCTPPLLSGHPQPALLFQLCKLIPSLGLCTRPPPPWALSP